MNLLQNYINNQFVVFTFKGITTTINNHNEEKKVPLGMPSWKQINKDNFKTYCKKNDKGFALITGKISQITVIDFDDINEYNKIFQLMIILLIIIIVTCLLAHSLIISI